jgi:hypothetical protein
MYIYICMCVCVCVYVCVCVCVYRLSDSAVQARGVYGVGGTRLALLTLFTSIKSGSLRSLLPL